MSSGHLFGTDSYGRDVLSRVVYGMRTSLALALSSIAISAALGSLIGILVAMRGGIFDYLATEFVNFLMAFPTLLVGLIMLAILGAGYQNLLITLSFVFTYRFIRLSRSFTLASEAGPTSRPPRPSAPVNGESPFVMFCPTSWADSSPSDPFGSPPRSWPRPVSVSSGSAFNRPRQAWGIWSGPACWTSPLLPGSPCFRAWPFCWW